MQFQTLKTLELISRRKTQRMQNLTRRQSRQQKHWKKHRQWKQKNLWKVNLNRNLSMKCLTKKFWKRVQHWWKKPCSLGKMRHLLPEKIWNCTKFTRTP
ncbi:hypothetical protein DWX98_06380 [Blautia sp. AF22-5LB]|nr:hypothetical protein DWX98_06380 [Blautia sp. AF22-5LB]